MPSASSPRRSGIVYGALALGGLAVGTTEFATMSILPLFARDLHVDLPSGGRAISAYAIGVVVGAPLFAVGGARLSRRTMLIAPMAWVAVANLLSALAPSFGWLLFFRFLSGLPHGAYFGLAALVAASLVEDDRRTVAVGRVMAGLTVATVVGARRQRARANGRLARVLRRRRRARRRHRRGAAASSVRQHDPRHA